MRGDSGLWRYSGLQLQCSHKGSQLTERSRLVSYGTVTHRPAGRTGNTGNSGLGHQKPLADSTNSAPTWLHTSVQHVM
jgi:hypothetical protein